MDLYGLQFHQRKGGVITDRGFQIEFERRLQLMDPNLVIKDKLSSDTIISFINEAIDKFYKTRYSGINFKAQGFEQTEKRIDDLRTLVRKRNYSNTQISKGTKNSYSVELPDDYVLLLGDTAGIQPSDEYPNECWEKDDLGAYIVKYTDTLESTIETIDRQLSNSLSEHKLKYCQARPLKLIQDNNVILYTDGKYKVSEYEITYLAKPSKINSSNITNTEYTDLPEHTHMEIVKMAIQIYLATKPMQHYNAYSNEIASME